MSFIDELGDELSITSYRHAWRNAQIPGFPYGYDPYGTPCIFGNEYGNPDGTHKADCNCKGTKILRHEKQIQFHESKAMFRAIISGLGGGKALSLDTPIPTPNGWTTMKAIQIGDTVFDENGKPTKVTAVHEVDAKRAWRVKFSDGAHLDACEDHQWTTWDYRARKSYQRGKNRLDYPENWPTWQSYRGSVSQDIGARIITTANIAATLKYNGMTNHAIPTCAPLDLPEADLPLSPYVFGYWLGDGNSGGPIVTVGAQDRDEAIATLSQHALISHMGPITKGGAGTLTLRSVKDGTLTSVLRSMGVLHNKHIPQSYLRASAPQRLALLQGLMDTDGYSSHKNVEFCTTNLALAHGVMELARSLGQKPVLHEGVAKLYGREISPKYRITWSPTISVFRFARKLATYTREGKEQQLRHRTRYIVAMEPIIGGHMRCISVDSTNHLYLAGEGMIPTHNSVAGAAELVRYCMENPGARVMIVAPTYPQLYKAAMEYFVPLLPNGLVKSKNEQKHEIILTNGCKIWMMSLDNKDSVRGPTVAAIWGDEAGMFDDGAFDLLLTRLRQNTFPLKLWLTTTPRGKNYLWKAFVDEPSKDEKLKEDWKYVQFRTEDNPHFPKKIIAMMKKKKEGTLWGRQELYGEFVAFEGQIYPQYNPEVHVGDWQKEFREGRLQFKSMLYGVDWGYTDPTTIYVAGIDGDRRIYILDEMYESGLDIGAAILKARGMVIKWGKGLFVCDSADQQKIASFNKAQLPAHDAYKPIEEGIAAVANRLLVQGDGKPRLFIDQSCRHMIDEIERYHFEEKEEDDHSTPRPAKGQMDHACDTLRYMVMDVDGGEQSWNYVKNEAVMDAINHKPRDMNESHAASLNNLPRPSQLWNMRRAASWRKY